MTRYSAPALKVQLPCILVTLPLTAWLIWLSVLFANWPPERADQLLPPPEPVPILGFTTGEAPGRAKIAWVAEGMPKSLYCVKPEWFPAIAMAWVRVAP